MSKNFLVVDDDPLTRMDLGDIVRSCGFGAWEAANTAEALSILQASPDTFAAVITDVQMPGTRSGLVLANHVRTLWPHIRVIVVTGGRVPFAGELPQETQFMSKPISVPALSEMISRAAAD